MMDARTIESILKSLPMEEIIKSAIQNGAVRVDMKQAPSQPGMNHDEVTEIKKEVTSAAKFARMQFEQFVAVGFTEEQAMELTIAILN